MKKFNFFWTLLLLLGVVSVATSCSDDDVPAVSTSVSFDIADIDEVVFAGSLVGKTTWIVDGFSADATDLADELGALVDCMELAGVGITLELAIDFSDESTPTFPNALAGCIELAAIEIDANATGGSNTELKFAAATFSDCTSLKSIDISVDGTELETVTLQGRTFSGCTALQSVEIKAANVLGGSEFDECPALTKVNLGANVLTVGTTLFGTSDSNGTNTNTENIALTVYVENDGNSSGKVTDNNEATNTVKVNKVYFGQTLYTFKSVADTNPGE